MDQVPYAVSTVYARGVATEMNGNIFFNGTAQPRYGFSDGLPVLNGTNLLQVRGNIDVLIYARALHVFTSSYSLPCDC